MQPLKNVETVEDRRKIDISKQTRNQVAKNHHSLFLSGLKNNVDAGDIKRQFPGCLRLKIREDRSTPDLKYMTPSFVIASFRT
jgi:hypothetical protein